jgi:glycosyltransferase involved in cell wall biosynthesis
VKFLVISEGYPKYDRASGDLRFFQLLKSLASGQEVFLVPYEAIYEIRRLGDEVIGRYREAVEALGVCVLDGDLRPILKRQRFDVVLFEFYFTAQRWLDEVRYLQPQATVVVDSVDIAFRRMHSKAELSGDASDFAEAERIRREEIAIYRLVDGVITVTPEDDAALHKELPEAPTFIIPNIHCIPARPAPARREPNTLLFIGSFPHPPNPDAMLYFVGDIFPHVIDACPEVKLRIVGYAPSPEILALASERVEVVGYVAETRPYLDTSYISIAPLRFGAGIKGKIGEAMAHGLPVVTTSVGIDGFGLTPGKNVLVGDSPKAFADAVINLLQDEALYRRIAAGGHRFIRRHYSEEAVRKHVDAFTAALPDCTIKRLPFPRYARKEMREWLDRNVLWRFK